MRDHDCHHHEKENQQLKTRRSNNSSPFELSASDDHLVARLCIAFPKNEQLKLEPQYLLAVLLAVFGRILKKAFMLCLVAFGDVRVAYFVLKGRQDILRNGNVKIYMLIEAKHQPDIAIFAK